VMAVYDRFSQQLVDEADLIREFIDILDEEQSALARPGAGAALAAAVARKTSQADKLQAAAQTRATLLAALGFAQDAQDLGPVGQRYPDLHPAIVTLVALADQARVKNQDNGLLIQTCQRHHQEAVLALQALSAPPENPLYDARGRIGRHLHRRTQGATIPRASGMRPDSFKGA